jgi:hypothetical protein
MLNISSSSFWTCSQVVLPVGGMLRLMRYLPLLQRWWEVVRVWGPQGRPQVKWAKIYLA